MNKRRFEDFETNLSQLAKSQGKDQDTPPPKNKLERRRAIEDMMDHKKLEEELFDF